ncbi:peptidoglycan DD-metalloendopeptidase family protein [Qipengyuania sp. DY56-A-20]|uniref:Peptidoglycan DD-metalloendopeptidase family protein n=1 Tax=Qipengyuania benthica TaxID=3067651 RepID=A0ABT9H3Y8_9SPHN|nr:peptidoglycan DD-metalloendopeptidase family protein [Qipengyuania sp. DY56-A-20]MDP4538024.1 peptidoglycan DD-metalloendopeptidase family protein [Qipengyuania sp. DY56-A-20]
MTRLLAAGLLGLLALGFWVGSGAPGRAQSAARFEDASQARTALALARQQALRARTRAERFDREAASSTQASQKAQAEAAALAARIQQVEAAIGVAEAQLVLVKSERRQLDIRLAERREPIVQLTGALQTLVRRPLSLSLFAPGSLRDTVYLGAVLDSTVPLVRETTADLRAELDRAAVLQRQARDAVAARRASETQLAQRRTELIAMAQRERIDARRAAGAADREDLRALALGERARDIDGLIEGLEQIGELRARLAALPGPVPRPTDPSADPAATPADVAAAPSPSPSSTAPPPRYRLPVDGRLVAAFGSRDDSSIRRDGLQLLPRSGAQVVAPGGGRIVFAGPYRGYGTIVIIEHANGWTSLVTGLSELAARVGQNVVAGSPLGMAQLRDPAVTLELRREGEPVNPLEFIA